jgi:hypothetical protein
MATKQTKAEEEERIRATVLRQARDIEDRKKLQARIADLVIEAFDLPSRPDADPSEPQPSDATLFKQCLSLFQTSDLDDLIAERNIDNRCGYALCPKPNKRVNRGGSKVWNGKAGKDFELVNRAEMEKWCSLRCQERTAFARIQLGTEPAWLRDVRAVNIKLLDEAGFGDLALADAFKVIPGPLSASYRMLTITETLSLGQDHGDEIARQLKALALERGESGLEADTNTSAIIERSSDSIPPPPTGEISYHG